MTVRARNVLLENIWVNEVEDIRMRGRRYLDESTLIRTVLSKHVPPLLMHYRFKGEHKAISIQVTSWSRDFPGFVDRWKGHKFLG